MGIVVQLYRVAVALLAAAGTSGVWLFLQFDQLRYFTNLTGLAILVVMTWAVVGRLVRRTGPPTWATGAVTLFGVVTGLVALLVLAPEPASTPPMVLGLTYGQVMHQVLPIAVLVDFILFTPHRRLRLSHAAAWAAVPVGYLVLSVLAGSLLGSGYPYPFIDVGALGWGSVLAHLVGVAVGAVGLAVALVGLDRALRPGAVIG